MTPTTLRLSASFVLIISSAPVLAQSTERVSVGRSGAQANAESSDSGVSEDGRYVAFTSSATNLLTVVDSNAAVDVFVRDRQLGVTERVSVGDNGQQSNGNSHVFALSPDGRFVAFTSDASNLVMNDVNGVADIFVRDRVLQTTEIVSISTGGVQGNGTSDYQTISSDGRYVAFTSLASNLVSGDSNGTWDVFVRDRQLGTTERASVGTGGTEASSILSWFALSADGRYVTFTSNAINLFPNDTNGTADVFVRDRWMGTTTLAYAGAQAINGESRARAITPDGRFVLLVSNATNHVAGDTNGAWDLFIRDRQLTTTTCVSVRPDGTTASGDSDGTTISHDGRFVAFWRAAPDLVPNDTNGNLDSFVRDMSAGTTDRVSVSSSGAQADGDTWGARMSDDGRFVAYYGYATTLAPPDTNNVSDVFLHDRRLTSIADFCVPGQSGVIACPCGNTNGPSVGCANTGGAGASLATTGVASLAQDAVDPGSLTLNAAGMFAGAACIFLQGDAVFASGTPFGAGVRCVGGQVLRLYVKSGVDAGGGAMSAPQPGDRSISNRTSDVLPFNPIVPGTYSYQVYYRDPGQAASGAGCPGVHTFNVTSGQLVVWGA